jgi:ribosomal 30S subunit maturation factor RimM
LPELDDDEIYIHQLEGFNLVTESGENLGVIEGFLDNQAPYPILIVLSPAGVKRMYPLPSEYFHEHDPQKQLVVISDVAACFTDNKY